MTNKSKITSEIKTIYERLVYARKWSQYLFERFMDHSGSSAIVIFGITLFVVLVGGLILYVTFPNVPYEINVLNAWMFVTNSGAHITAAESNDPNGNPQVNWNSFFAGLFVTIAGLVVTGMLIGFLTDFVRSYMDYLKQGDGRIMESGHFLILGWNDKLPSFLKSCSNAKEFQSAIVILADKKKEVMDSIIQSIQLPGGPLNIITKEGNPLIVAELEKVSPCTARSIVVLADENIEDDPDSHTIMKIICVLGGFEIKGHIVAEAYTPEKFELMKKVGGQKIAPIFSTQLVCRLLCQCGRQTGLAACYLDVIDFGGSEFFSKNFPELEGKTFGEALNLFEDSCILCGVLTQDKDGQKVILANPPDSYIFKKDDFSIALAEESHYLKLRPKPISVSPQLKLQSTAHQTKGTKNFLLIGWRPDMDDVLQELCGYCHSGSRITIFNSKPLEERNISYISNDVEFKHVVGSTTLYSFIKKIVENETYDTIFVVSEKAMISTIHDAKLADNKTVVTTLILNDILRHSELRETASLEKDEKKECLIVSEINDSEKMEIVSNFQDSPCDWVIGNELVGMVMAQIAFDINSRYILDELLTPEGNDIYLHPVELYVPHGTSITFYELYLLGRRREPQEVVIGYRKKNTTCILNPAKKHERILLEAGDQLAVICLEL